MIVQHPAPEGDTRTRTWVATVGAPGGAVIVQHAAVLAPGEDLTETPETRELTWVEWVQDHAAVYGCEPDGTQSTIFTANRAAWRRIRRVAAGTDPVDAAFATAVLRVLRGIAREVAD